MCVYACIRIPSSSQQSMVLCANNYCKKINEMKQVPIVAARTVRICRLCVHHIHNVAIGHGGNSSQLYTMVMLLYCYIRHLNSQIDGTPSCQQKSLLRCLNLS